MKDLFPGFYRLSSAEFDELWKDCLFVLDTNVLLNLYRYPEKARDELIEVLSRVSERLWIPHHVALEFQRNRPFVIAEQRKRFRQVRDVVLSAQRKLEAEIDGLQLNKRHASIDPNKLTQNIAASVTRFFEELDESEKIQIDVHESDPLRDRIDSLLGGRVGNPPKKQKAVDEVYAEGERRIEIEMPPGYLDAEKDSGNSPSYSYGGIQYQKKFGDLLIWKQILQHASDAKIRHVVLVTDDDKADWWWSIDSGGTKRLGPRTELVDEIRRETPVELFYMYSSEQFLAFSSKYLHAEVSQESIEQVRDVASETRARTRSVHKDRQIAEAAVIDWLTSYFPEAVTIARNRGFPDIIVELGNRDEKHGFDVYAMGVPRSVVNTFQDRIYRAYYEIKEKNFNSISLVFTSKNNKEYIEIERKIRRNIPKLPPGVSIIIGELLSDEESDLGTRFVHGVRFE